MVAARQQGKAPDSLILVEHPPVITLGRGGGGDDLLLGRKDLGARGFGVFHIDRGGKATSHMPGQMVAYPIVKVRDMDLHLFLEKLLAACAEVIKGLGLKPERNPAQPGVWVNGAKVASVGIAVKKWVTYHGLALNVCPDLGGFDFIVPCGLPGQPVTSLERELGFVPDMERVKLDFVRAFSESFEYAQVDWDDGNTPARPFWLVRPAPSTEPIERMENLLRDQGLTTVCQEAHCPNLGECFNHGTATFMILGERCTRNCRFCAVKHGPVGPPDTDEPLRLALAASRLKLDYVVITSVTRDDLPDGGAGRFVACIREVHRHCPGAKVEVLHPGFSGPARTVAPSVRCQARCLQPQPGNGSPSLCGGPPPGRLCQVASCAGSRGKGGAHHKIRAHAGPGRRDERTGAGIPRSARGWLHLPHPGPIPAALAAACQAGPLRDPWGIRPD